MAYKNFGNYNIVRFETELTDEGHAIKGYTFKDIFEKLNDTLFIAPLLYDVEGTVFSYSVIVGGAQTNHYNIFILLDTNNNGFAYANEYNGPVFLNEN